MLAICAVFALGALAQVQAQEKASVAGVYQWTVPGRNGAPDRTNTLVLKLEGEKLTGTVSALRKNEPNETKIEDAKLVDGTISFALTHEFSGNKMVTKYSGKVTAEGIKGKSEFGPDGHIQSRDWEAKRQLAQKK